MQVFPLQNEIFLLLKIENEPFVFSLDPYLQVLKCHLVSFTSRKTDVVFRRDDDFKVCISENKIQLDKHSSPSSMDVSILASQIMLGKKFSSTGVFIRKKADK